MMKSILSILIISSLLLFPQLINASNNQVVLYPAFIEVPYSQESTSYTYTVENNTENDIVFIPSLYSLSQDKNTLEYTYSEIKDKKIKEQVKFEKESYTLKQSSKVVVNFKINPLKSIDKGQYFAINNEITTTKDNISIGSGLNLLLFLTSKSDDNGILGLIENSENTLFNINKFEVNKNVLIPSNKVDIEIQNISDNFIKPVVILELNKENELISRKRISEDGVRLLPQSFFKASENINWDWKFKLLPLPEEYLVRIKIEDNRGLQLLSIEKSFYYFPIIQIIVYIALAILLYLGLKKYLLPVRKPGSVE